MTLTTVVEECTYDHNDDDDEERKAETQNYVLVSTRKFDSPKHVILSYSLRVTTEECFRQLKGSWKITDFPSPHRSLIEAHVGFTLITYCLFQLFLSKEQHSPRTRQMILTLMRDHVTLQDAHVAYANGHFGIFGTREFYNLIIDLPKEAQYKIKEILNAAPNQF